MDSQRKLEEIFAHFPGIGPRQAKRFVYYLLAKSPATVKEFADLVLEVKKSTAECSQCHRFFMNGAAARGALAASSAATTRAVCSICSDKSRDATLLMVIARDSDFESVEKSGAYKGYYFILGGTVPLFDTEPEKRIRLRPLIDRLNTAGSPVKEVILSMNATPDGENTADIVKRAIESSQPTKPSGPTGHASRDGGSLYKSIVTVLGRGLSTGAELEYVDPDTIMNALKHRG